MTTGRLLQIVLSAALTALSVGSCLPHPQPQPVPPVPLRPVVVWVETAAGPLEGAVVAYGGFQGQTAADGHVGFDLPANALNIHVAVQAAGFRPYGQVVDLPAGTTGLDLCVCPKAHSGQIQLPALTPLVTARHGRVRLRGRAWLDDDGDFRPLGATLMWALYGWHSGDRARVEQNLAHLQSHGWDSVRIMATLGWPEGGIDPAWPDYTATLASFIDAAYDTYGLRTELSIMDSGVTMDPVAVARLVASVIPGREHKVLYIEPSNEMNGASFEQIHQMVDVLKPTGVLVGASNCERTGCALEQLVAQTGADFGSVHPERDLTSYLDSDWRQVRQFWYTTEFPFAVAGNEPAGPRSSIAENTDPLQLAMMRAGAIIAGTGAWVLHNGAGVAGRVDPAHNRPANIYEVPGIDAIEDAVRSIDPYIPADVENWNHSLGNIADVNNPLRADYCWLDPGAPPQGVVRMFSSWNDREFISLALGVRNTSTIMSRWSADITVTKFSGAGYGSPMTTETIATARPQAAGSTFVLQGPSDAHAAFVIRGTR